MQAYLNEVGLGHSANASQAAKRVGLTDGQLRHWRKKNILGFRTREQLMWEKVSARRPPDRMDHPEPVSTAELPMAPVPDFETFRMECFGHGTPAHQKRWLDAIEDRNRLLILMPPEHGKTSFMEEYVVWRVCKDRHVKVVYVSKSGPAAVKRGGRIATLLSDPTYYDRNGWRNVVTEWGPFKPTGKESARLPWSQSQLYVIGHDPADRDPTVEALGVGQQIQGARADLIVLDDVADDINQATPGQVAKIQTWIAQQGLSRLPPGGGQLLMIGTRVNEYDLYSRYLEKEAKTWHRIISAAILDEREREVLWPEHWPYEALVARRDDDAMTPRAWALTYQQQGTGMPDAPFTLEAVEEVKDGSYMFGAVNNELEHYIGCDPALTGTSAVVVVGFHRPTGTRYLVDVITGHDLKYPERMHDMLIQAAAKYRAREVRVEKNAMQGFFSRDRGLGLALRAIGARLVEQYTGVHNKFDPDWGVSSIAAQFMAGRYRIPWAIPSPRLLEGFLAELMIWRAEIGKRQKQDQVMAFWLAELSVRENEKIPIGHGEPAHIPRWIKRQADAGYAPPWVKERFGVAR